MTDLEQVLERAATDVCPVAPSTAGYGLVLDGIRQALRRRLLSLLEEGHKSHHAYCEDGFYACPKNEEYFGTDSGCNCGKDEYDAALETAKGDLIGT